MSEHVDSAKQSQSTAGPEAVKFLWEVIKAVVIGLAAVFSFLANQNSEKAKQAVEAAKVAAAERAQQSQFDIKAYELVEKTLILDPTTRKSYGIAAAAIVNALTKAPLRDELQNALRAGVTEPTLVRQLDDSRQFDLENSEFGTPAISKSTEKRSSLLGKSFALADSTLNSSAWAQPLGDSLSGYRIDILYCEAPSATQTETRKARADDAREKLVRASLSAEVRVRLLPTLVQARPGYQSFSDEVRANDEQIEKDAARRVAEIISVRERSVHRTEGRRPKYIAVFYCASS